MNTQYKSFSRKELDTEYDATANIKDRAEMIVRFTDLSDEYIASTNAEIDVQYGQSDDEMLDIFLPKNLKAYHPVHVFIHGGYWYQFTKKEWSFVAKALCDKGAIVVIPTYSLCPEVRVSEILWQTQRMIAWLYDNIARYGGDREQLYLSGHSAGGYLAVGLMLTDWRERYNLPLDLVKGVTTISGVFDLEPLQHCYLQDYLHLDDREISLLDLRERIGVGQKQHGRMDIFVGGSESSEFERQSLEFKKSWCDAGNLGSVVVLEGKNHLDVLFELSSAEGSICQAVCQQMNLYSLEVYLS